MRTLQANALQTLSLLVAIAGPGVVAVVFAAPPDPDEAEREEAASPEALRAQAKELEGRVNRLFAAGRNEEALPLAEACLELKQRAFGPEHEEFATALNDLGLIVTNLGDHRRAVKLMRQAVAVAERALGPDHGDVAIAADNLGMALQTSNQLDAALASYQRAHDILVKLYGAEHADVGAVLGHLASCRWRLGGHAEARALAERALAIQERALGEDHPLLAQTLNNFALMLIKLEEPERALRFLERARAGFLRRFGAGHRQVATVDLNLAQCHVYLGRPEEVAAALERAKDCPPVYEEWSLGLRSRAVLASSRGRVAEAIALLERALAAARLDPDDGPEELVACLVGLGDARFDGGDFERGEALFREAVAVCERSLPARSASTGGALVALGRVLRVQGRYAEAEVLLERAVGVLSEVRGGVTRHHLGALSELALLRGDLGQYAVAIEIQRDALRRTEQILGREHPALASVLLNLGRLLQGAGEYDEAIEFTLLATRMCEASLSPDHPAVGKACLQLANLRYLMGPAESAREDAQRGLRILEAALGSEHPDVGRALGRLGAVTLAGGDAPAAATLQERGAETLARALGAEHPSTLRAESNLIGTLVLGARLDDARVRAERVVEALRRAPDSQRSRELVVALAALASVDLAQGNARTSLAHAQEALPMALASFGPSHPQTARSHMAVARALQFADEHNAARENLLAALAIFESGLGGDHKEAAGALMRLGYADLRQGRLQPAVDWLERSRRSLVRSESDPILLATVLKGLAEIATLDGRLDEGLALLDQGESLLRTRLPPDHELRLPFLSERADIFRRQGRLPEAGRLFERALEGLERAKGPGHSDLATAMVNYASILMKQGAIPQARALIDQAQTIVERVFREEHRAVSSVRVARARLLLNTGDYAAATRQLSLVLATLEGVEGAEAEVSNIRSDLAGAEMLAGNPERALLMLQRVLAAERRTLGPDHLEVAVTLDNLAILLLHLGRHAEARRLLEEELGILEARGTECAATRESGARLNHARALAALGEPEAARVQAGRGLEVLHASVSRQLTAAPQADRMDLLSASRWGLDDYLDLVWDDPDAAYAAVLRFKGLAGRLAEVERRALDRAGPEPRALIGELRAAQGRLAKLTHARVRRGASDARYAEAIRRCEDLARQVAAAGLDFEEVETRLALGVGEVRRALRKGEAVVDFLRHGGHYSAWVTRPGAPLKQWDLGPAEAIEGGARDLRRALLRATSEEDPAFQAAGQAVRALTLSVIEEALGDEVTTLYIVPDGALATVAFAALPGRAPKTRLWDERVLVYLSTAQDLVPWEGERRAPSEGGALLVGEIDYGRPVPGELAGQGQFAPLSATAAELLAIRAWLERSAWGSVATLRGADATENALRRLAVGRRLVHLATHGFVARGEAPLVAAAAGERGVLPSLVRRLAVVDPMLHAGLALAGANLAGGSAADDGILTAVEVGGLDLAGAELVVLSACDTARGTVRAGEGVLGLVRAFRQAGARNVVASLWSVEDVAAAAFMTGFYRQLQLGHHESRPAAEALREAALALRRLEVEVPDPAQSLRSGRPVRRRKRPFAAPRHWAAFAAYGPLR